MSLSNATTDLAYDRAVALGDRLHDWRLTINPRDIALEKVSEDVAALLGRGIQVSSFERQALLTLWCAVYGRALRTNPDQVGDIGHLLNCNEERPS